MNNNLNIQCEKIQLNVAETMNKTEEDKKLEELPVESNSDSNKSNGNFQNPSSQITSSSVSTSKELSYMTPKSMHNLNLLFTQSNGKKSQHQRRIMNNSHDFSPVEDKFMNYTFNIPMSPIDASKMSAQLSNPMSKGHNIHEFYSRPMPAHSHTNIQLNNNSDLLAGSSANRVDNLQRMNPNNCINSNSNNKTNITQYIFNNNQGEMSKIIENRHMYDSLTAYENLKKVNRKIEFTNTNSEINTAFDRSSLIISENLNKNIIAQGRNFSGNVEDLRKMSEDSDEEKFESSEDISIEEIPSDSESLVKPLPISGLSMSKLNNNVLNPCRIYINPYNFNEASIQSNSYIDQAAYFRGYDTNQFQKKLQTELEKKTFSCNCKKSKCLKLYCECFANGEYCINCNCTGCSNVIGNEVEKEEAFKLIKDKNPVAMKLNTVKEEEQETKIGCNCTKSNCSKKYCECYKANMKCSEACRCRDCGNASDHLKHLRSRSLVYGQQKDLLNETDFYHYEEFSIEKISILIENKKIYIHKALYKDLDKIKFLREKINFFPKEEISNPNDIQQDNPSLIIKRENNSIFLQISKSILNTNILKNSAYIPVHTPIINKFRKSNRKNSLDSYNSQNTINNISGYNKFTKTACETSKKISNIMSIPKNIGKKLILDDTDRK